MPTIEKLTNDTNTIASELEAIKKLAETERAPKQTELKTQIDQVQGELQSHLQSLQSKTDAQSANERAKTEQLLTNIQSANDKLLQLGAEVQWNAKIEPTNEETTWVKEHRKKIWSKDERKNNTTGNLARLWVVAWAVTGVTWLRNKVSWRFNGWKSESNKKSSWWQKILKWIGIAWWSALAVAGGSKLRDKLKERLPDIFGPELSFEDAFTKVKADLHTVSEKHLDNGADMSRTDISEGKVSLTSYGQTIEIDTKTKTIPWMNVEFKTFDQVIHAANLANFTKWAFRGRCKSNDAFSESEWWWWDLQVNLLEEGKEEFMSGQWLPMGKIIAWLSAAGIIAYIPGATKILGIKWSIATIAGAIALWHYWLDKNDTLNKICPQIADGVWKQAFLSYLNRLWIRAQWHESQTPVTDTIFAKQIEAMRAKFKKDKYRHGKETEFKDHGNARTPDIVPDKTNADKFIFKSRSKETPFFYDPTYKTITLEWIWVFTDIDEAIGVANLTNKLVFENRWKCNSDQPFSYKGHVTWLLHPGLYIDNQRFDDRSLSEDAFKKHFPTLYKQREKYIDYLNTLKGRKE